MSRRLIAAAVVVAVAAAGILVGTGVVGGDSDPAGLTGGDGADRLTGTEGDDEIRGGAGDDQIEAGGGDDEVDGGEGRDFLDGGAGDDRFLEGEDDALDVHDCGEGDDLVAEPDARDELQPSCERAGWTALPPSGEPYEHTIVVKPRLKGRRARFTATCAEPGCRGEVELRTPNGRDLLGSGRFDLAAGTPGPIAARLTRRGGQTVAVGGYVRVVLRVAGVNSGFTTYMKR
jgi:hypothetical protein